MTFSFPYPSSPHMIPLRQATMLRRHDPYSCLYGRPATPPAEAAVAEEETEGAPGAQGEESGSSRLGGMFWNRRKGSERRKALVDGFVSLFRSSDLSEGIRSFGFGPTHKEPGQETGVKEAVQPENEQGEELQQPEQQPVQLPEVSTEPAAEESPSASAVTDPEPESSLPAADVALEEQGSVEAAEEEEGILEETGLELPIIVLSEGMEVEYEEDQGAQAEAPGGQETKPSAANSFLEAALALQARIGGVLSPDLAIAAAATAVSFVLAAGCVAVSLRLLPSSGPVAPGPDETVEEVGAEAPATFPATPAAAAAAKASSSPLSPTQLMAQALATPLNAIGAAAASAARGAAPRSVFVSASSRLSRTGSKENRVRFNVEFDDTPAPTAARAAPGPQANLQLMLPVRSCYCSDLILTPGPFPCIIIALLPKQSRPTMPGRPPPAVQLASPRPETPLPAPEEDKVLSPEV